MRRLLACTILFSLCVAMTTWITGCRRPVTPSGGTSTGKDSSSGGVIAGVGYALPVKGVKYEILNILTDDKKMDLAKSNAESALVAHPDIKCMVGLWSYNPPMILSALKDRRKVGDVKIVAFDEAGETLAGISDGSIHGTIVQQPYLFGFRSVEYLAAMARKQDFKIPEDKMIFVPHTVVKSDSVLAFNARIKDILAGKGEIPTVDRQYDTKDQVKLIFVTNNVDPFWMLAQEGVKRANPIFNVECSVRMPSSATVEEQKADIETFINNKGQGMAISPINAANQVEMLNKAAAVMPVICQDSDAPTSNRDFYIGTNNYMAGRSAGKLVKEAIPDGGKVMLFVGKLEAQNAQDRSRGVIDELLDKEVPKAFQ